MLHSDGHYNELVERSASFFAGISLIDRLTMIARLLKTIVGIYPPSLDGDVRSRINLWIERLRSIGGDELSFHHCELPHSSQDEMDAALRDLYAQELKSNYAFDLDNIACNIRMSAIALPTYINPILVACPSRHSIEVFIVSITSLWASIKLIREMQSQDMPKSTIVYNRNIELREQCCLELMSLFSA